MTNMNKMLPGLLDDSIEFFVADDRVKVLSSGKVTEFTDLSFATIQKLKVEINSDKQVKLHLHDMHPHSEFKRMEQFVRCRFGGLDYAADLSHDGIQSGEYWDCPLRGSCASEGVLCKSVTINGATMGEQDIELAKRLSTDQTNEVIAGEMNLPMGTFHLAKKMLYRKLGVSTKQEVSILSHRHNLI